MIDLPYTKLLMVAALLLLLLLIARTLHKRDKSLASKLNLEDFLLGEDGKISKVAGLAWGAFGATTWLMVFLALQNKMTEGYFGLYLTAWVAPTITKLFKGPSPVQESMTVETASTSTQTITKP